MPKFTMPKFKLPKFKLPEFKLHDPFEPPVEIRLRDTLSKEEVKAVFKKVHKGVLFKFYVCFEDLDGEEMCALSYEDFVKRCETAGEALYFWWFFIKPHCKWSF